MGKEIDEFSELYAGSKPELEELNTSFDIMKISLEIYDNIIEGLAEIAECSITTNFTKQGEVGNDIRKVREKINKLVLLMRDIDERLGKNLEIITKEKYQKNHTGDISDEIPRASE